MKRSYTKSKLNTIKRGHKRAIYEVDKINEIIDAGFIGYMSYVFDGMPVTLPMAYGRNDNKIYLHGSQANRMLRSMLELDEMSLTIMHLDALVLARSGLHHSVNYRSATLFGPIQEITSDKDKTSALKRVMEHMIPGRWDHLRPIKKVELDRTLVIQMTIDQASAKIRETGVEDEIDDYEFDIWAGLIPLSQTAKYPIPDKGKPQKMLIPQHVLDYYDRNKE